MKNVIAYVRIDADGQTADDKFGIEHQKRIIASYCEKRDMTVTEWYVECESGVNENRPQLNKILHVDANPSAEAVVAKADRIARGTELYCHFATILEKRRMKLISAMDDDAAIENACKLWTLLAVEQERNNTYSGNVGGDIDAN